MPPEPHNYPGPAAVPEGAQPRISLSRRLIAGVWLSQLFLALALLGLGVLLTRRQLLAAFDTDLRSRAMAVAALVRYSERRPHNLKFDPTLLPPSRHRRLPNFYYVLKSAENHSGMARIAAYWPQVVPPALNRARFMNLRLLHHNYRVIVLRRLPVLDKEAHLPHPLPRLTVYYAAPLSPLLAQVENFALYIAVPSGLLLLLAAGLTVWGIRRGLGPLRGLAHEAAAISDRNWSFHPAPEAVATAELTPLIAALEAMLERLHGSFLRQKQFLSDAAHELKTPVTILKTTLQSLLQKPREADEYRQGMEQSLEDLDRLQALLERMLRLARVEQLSAPAAPRPAPVNLKATCAAAVARIAGWAATRGIQITQDDSDGFQVAADADDLEQLWLNLLENAVKFTPEGGLIRISLQSPRPGWVRVSVEDTGPGIAACDLERIFDRFYRSEPSRDRQTGGFGLGLAIARGVAEAAGGKIYAQNRPTGGASLNVELPLS